jgi:AcrR family transcriptional regulator
MATTQTELSTKDRIFMTAAQLFGTYGYERVSIRQICEEVGVGKPTLYYYFKDKETLLEELIDYAIELGQKLLQEFLNPEDNYPARLLGIIRTHQAYVKRYPYFIRFITMLNLSALPDRIRQKMIMIHRNRYNQTRDFFQEGIQLGHIPRDIDLNVLIASFLGTINQLVFMDIFAPVEYQFDDNKVHHLYQLWTQRIFNQS